MRGGGKGKTKEGKEYTKKNESTKVKTQWWGKKKVRIEPRGCTDKPACAPLFVPRTPNGVLAVRLCEAEQHMNEYCKRKVKVVEEGGTMLTKMLFKPDPWEGRNCGRLACQACKAEGGGN